MKRETFFCAALLVLLGLPVSGETLAELFSIASATNQTSLSSAMDLKVARMRFEKGTIEARDEQARLTAESTYLQALAAYRRSLQTFYNEVIDTILDAADADISRRTALLALDSRREEQASAEAGYPKGRISAEALADSRLAYKTAELDNEQSVYELQEFGGVLRNSTGLEWKESLLPEVIPGLKPEKSSEDWIADDPAVRRAVIAERIAAIVLDFLPGNATRYDRQLAEVELEKAKLGTSQAKAAADRSYRNLIQRGKSQYATVLIRKEQLENQESLARDADSRYRRGLISSVQRNQEHTRALTANSNYYQALRTYLKTLLEYIVATDGGTEDLK